MPLLRPIFSMTRRILYPLIGLLFFASCSVTSVKKYQPGVPFVFENKVNIVASRMKVDTKSDLQSKLEAQIEDSVKPKPKTWLFVYQSLKRPPKYDTNYIAKSRVNMKNLLTAQGYFFGNVKSDTSLTVRSDQKRVKVTYTVEPGKNFIIDSVRISFNDSGLQKLALAKQNETLLKKKTPFTYGLINEELNRLMVIYRNNGYFKLTRDDLYAEVDTVLVGLIDPTLDPFEQIRLLTEGLKKKQSPTISIELKQAPPKDSSHLFQYKVGEVFIYPDVPFTGDYPDTLTTIKVRRFTIRESEDLFRPRTLIRNISLRPDSIFRQNDFAQTLYDFNKIPAWQNASLQAFPVDSTKKVDFSLRLVPAKRHFFSIDLEGSSILNSNQNTILVAGNNGLAVNFVLKNRNVAKRAIQLENVLRAGIEFNNFAKILSNEFASNNRLVLPWLASPIKLKKPRRFLNPRSFISLDGSYVDRYNYYRVLSLNTNFGYEWKTKPNELWQFKPINIEYTKFLRVDSAFEQALKDFPLLAYSYNNGLVIGPNISYSLKFSGNNPRKVNAFRVSLEESGLIMGALFKGLTDTGHILENLYRFWRADLDFRHYITNASRKTNLIFRFHGGYGHGYATRSNNGATLPFFKQYIAGGPNSMRGWQLRKLGIGSNIFYDTLENGKFNDRYADIILEGNIEYRFDLFPIYGFWIRGALFTDVGNIWNSSTNTLANVRLEYADLSLNRFYTDLGVDAGAGVRVDFNFFLLRFDFGFPLKNPLYASDPAKDPMNDGWFVKDKWNKPTFQFGLGYPF